jgi:tripartite-type tricarboxylate transporter receptor subunit TctC
MRSLLVLGFTALVASATMAQDNKPAWPKKIVTFVVPSAAGAAADIGARVIASDLSAKWKQPVIVENRPGGDSLIAIKSMLASNDDHVFLFSGSGSFTVHPYKYKQLEYDRRTDLIPVASISSTVVGVVASTKSNIASLKELVARAKETPGKLNVVMLPGITELVWDSFAKGQAIDIVKVPYSNIMSGMQDLAVGNIDLAMTGYAIFQPVLQANSIRMLAITSTQRTSLSPDIGTVLELGFPDLHLEGLVGLFGQKSLSPAAVAMIADDVFAAVSKPDIAEKLLATGQTPKPGRAAEFAQAVEEQEAQIRKIVVENNIQPK